MNCVCRQNKIGYRSGLRYLGRSRIDDTDHLSDLVRVVEFSKETRQSNAIVLGTNEGARMLAELGFVAVVGATLSEKYKSPFGIVGIDIIFYGGGGLEASTKAGPG